MPQASLYRFERRFPSVPMCPAHMICQKLSQHWPMGQRDFWKGKKPTVPQTLHRTVPVCHPAGPITSPCLHLHGIALPAATAGDFGVNKVHQRVNQSSDGTYRVVPLPAMLSQPSNLKTRGGLLPAPIIILPAVNPVIYKLCDGEKPPVTRHTLPLCYHISPPPSIGAL